MNNVGLVLEGGGMRGLYTAGALELFLEKGVEFGYIIGVSAGACNAASYISRQKGRNKTVNTAFVKDWRFASLRNFILKGSLFGMDFIFDQIPNRLVPFDYETFNKSPVKYKITATDCDTGEPVYFDKSDLDRKFTVLRASSSLPLVSPMINFGGRSLLDGGIADPLPIHKAVADGFLKNVIILTRSRGYRKGPVSFPEQLIYRAKYRKCPELIKAIMHKHIVYNEALGFIEELEQKGQAVVIRPSGGLKVGRYERDTDKLLDLYSKGYEDAASSLERIKVLSGLSV